jgi:hypothetical protein
LAAMVGGWRSMWKSNSKTGWLNHQFDAENDGFTIYALSFKPETAIFALFPAWHND